MSDVPHGERWWQASDGKWYAPELHPDASAPAPAPAAPAGQPSRTAWIPKMIIVADLVIIIVTIGLVLING